MDTMDSANGLLGRSLNALGVALVSYSFLSQLNGTVPVWVSIAALVTLVAWAAAVLLPGRWDAAATTLLIIMAIGGSLATAPTYGLLVVPVVVAVLRTVGVLTRPLWWGIGLACLSIALVGVGALSADVSAGGLASMIAGIVVAALGGYSRRQYRAASEQSRILTEERVRAREERARVQVLDERQAVARDMHDVLAHSLGGLVIQLDAAEALLEAGRVDEATARVSAARALAVDGLDEARRAVGALRDRDAAAAVPGAALFDDITRLSDEHRTLGGTVTLGTTGTPRPLAADQATALRRAMQEALTNARKHAPGVPVDATLNWTIDDVTLTVSNDSENPGAPPVQGEGHFGLAGMRERFARMPNGSVVAGQDGDRFVVSATVGLS